MAAMAKFRSSMFMPVLLGLTGCTVASPVVGQFDNSKEVLYGELEVKLAGDSELIRVEAEESGFRCTGTLRVLHRPVANYIINRCNGDKGDAHLECSDGRIINADWEALSCGRSFGAGYDQHGTRFSFTVGMKKDKALDYIEQARAIVANTPTEH